MKKLLILILFVIPTVTFSQTTQNENVLKEGTILKVILNEEINGKTASAGQSIEFKLGEDLVINNVEIAPRGAKVIGKITEAERS